MVVASDEAVVAAVAVVVVVDVVVVAASVRLKLYDTVPVAMGCPSDESSKHRFSLPFRCHTKMPSHASSLMQWLAQSAFGMLVYVASLALVSNAVPKRSGESVFSGTAPSYASTKPSSSSGSAVEDVVVASDEAVVVVSTSGKQFFVSMTRSAWMLLGLQNITPSGEMPPSVQPLAGTRPSAFSVPVTGSYTRRV